MRHSPRGGRADNDNPRWIGMCRSFSSMGWNNCTILKTPRTFRSSILADDQSGVVSNGPPHVAPALATKMSIWSVCCLTASTNLATSSRFPTSAAMPTAWPLMPESAFSRLTAWSMPCSPPALRAVTMTSLAPWRRKAVAACSPRPESLEMDQWRFF